MRLLDDASRGQQAQLERKQIREAKKLAETEIALDWEEMTGEGPFEYWEAVRELYDMHPHKLLMDLEKIGFGRTPQYPCLPMDLWRPQQHRWVDEWVRMQEAARGVRRNLLSDFDTNA